MIFASTLQELRYPSRGGALCRQSHSENRRLNLWSKGREVS